MKHSKMVANFNGTVCGNQPRRKILVQHELNATNAMISLLYTTIAVSLSLCEMSLKLRMNPCTLFSFQERIGSLTNIYNS